MLESLTGATENPTEPRDRRIYGVTLALVITNIDTSGEGQVQIRLPWLPGFEPWARLAALDAGGGRGSCFIPQVGDEVLVAFNHGDVREPYILGCLWSTQRRPPLLDPVNQRLIRTPAGHEIAFDDAAGSITITSMNKQRIQIDRSSIQIANSSNTASLTIDEKSGNITLYTGGDVGIQANGRFTVNAATIDIQASARMSLNGGGLCDVQAAMVKIN